MNLSSVDQLKSRWFPAHMHPYRALERLIDEAAVAPSTVLDIGCGRTAPLLAQLRGKARRLIGIDLTPFAIDEPALELVHASANNMPMIEDQSVDLAYSRSVMEHLEDPGGAFREIARVLKPGGRYIALTPSFWDYASLIAWVVPSRFHGAIVRLVEGRDEADTFPTYYRANTRVAIERWAAMAELQVSRFEYLGQYPVYLMRNRMLFWLGCHYERFITRYEFLHPLRGWILCEVRKNPPPHMGFQCDQSPSAKIGPPAVDSQRAGKKG